MKAIGSPAFTALVEACRRWLELEPRAGGFTGVDWSEVGRLGFLHNLHPLLHRLVESGRIPAAEVPASVVATWESAHYRNYLFNARALELLERLHQAAREAEAPFVAFKGPATMARAYGDPALRIMVDLDLLLARADLDALAAGAARLGFVASGRDHLLHATSSHPDSGLGLELHHDIYDFLLRRQELVERTLAERVELELDGRSFPAAPPELALVLDVAHMVHHDFRVDLRSWLDLATLLFRRTGRRTDRLDWPALERALERYGMLPELRLVVEAAAKLFSLPAETVPVYRPSGYPEAARTDLLERLARLERGHERPAMQELAYRQGLLAKASFLRRRLLPTGGRWRALTGGRGATSTLAAWWRQARSNAAQELGRWRVSGLASGAGSIKAAVYARNRGSGGA